MKIAIPSLLFILAMTSFTSCEKNKIATSDELETIGILGKWKLEMRLVNNISSLAVPCCDSIEFRTNDHPNDLKGVFYSTSSGYTTQGVFELNTEDHLLEFSYANTRELREFYINSDLLTFIYTDLQEGNVEEQWRKLE